MVRGLDTRSVQPHRIRKSYGKERTFREDISEREYILRFIEGLSATISEGMRSIPAAGKTITLKLSYMIILKPFHAVLVCLIIPMMPLR